MRTLAICLFLIFFSACTGKYLYEPNPIHVTSTTNKSKIRGEVLHILAVRGWEIDKDWEEFVEATKRKRRHTATVRVHYDRREVRIQYFSSQNIKYRYKNGKRYIHKIYNRWVQDLERDLRFALGSERKVKVYSEEITETAVDNTTKSYKSDVPGSRYIRKDSPNADSPLGANQGAIKEDERYY